MTVDDFFGGLVGGCVFDYMWQGVRQKQLPVCSALVIIYSWHHIVKTAAESGMTKRIARACDLRSASRT